MISGVKNEGSRGGSVNELWKAVRNGLLWTTFVLGQRNQLGIKFYEG